MTANGTGKFSLGLIVATSGAVQAMAKSGQTPELFLDRHAAGDWGNLDQHDMEQNELALKDGSRLFSAYRTARGEKLWIITEAEPRNSTCILTPEEY